MKKLTREWVAKAEGDLHSCLVFRYPGLSASKADAGQALVTSRTVRRAVRRSLGLKN